MDTNLCEICEEGPKTPSQKFGPCCVAKVKVTMRSAAKQGLQAKSVFAEIKKVGGKHFLEAVEEAYAKIKAFAAGTTDEPWDWMDYSMTVKFITSVQKGTRMACPTVGDFIDFWKRKTNDSTARQQWFTEVNQLPAGRVNKDKSDILYPVKRYVDLSSSRNREEALRLGQKQKKNTTAEEHMGHQSRMGRWHERLDDKVWSRALGMGEGALECVEAGEFARPQDEETQEAQFSGEQAAAMRAQRMEDKKAVAEAKLLSKPFNAVAHLGVAKPPVLEKLSKMATRSHIAIKKADDLLTEIDADESLKKTIKDARDTLDLRLQMLRACVGNPESTIEADKATWNTFQESEPVQQGMKVSEPIATIDAHTSFSELDEYCTNFTFEGILQNPTLVATSKYCPNNPIFCRHSFCDKRKRGSLVEQHFEDI